MMILFLNSNMGKNGEIKRKLNLYRSSKLFKQKLKYLHDFCNKNFEGPYKYDSIVNLLDEIDDEIIKQTGGYDNPQRGTFDINFMFYHYLLRSYIGPVTPSTLKQKYYTNIHYKETILENYIKPIFTEHWNLMSERYLLDQPLIIVEKTKNNK